jgi:hypothetical protein
MANFGLSFINNSHAAKNVSPLQPLSSISRRLLDIIMEKFLQDVPATKMLNSGKGFS